MASARRLSQATGALTVATLVFSAVGTALGGPVGSAIGALIGQSIDQELLAPVRRGPRVGDLNVQTSSYGTQIPRIFGTMRVAGSVIWATDLVEQAAANGAKGQPDVTYSYSVSLAVALSSRPANGVKRIWADGKLLRGAAGDFKVDTSFRFYDGSEDQAVDPLIGSVEGMSSTPCYRGLALAVFENLQLAEFGNRIPFLTFEIEADKIRPTLGSVLTDAAKGAIVCAAGETISGFAAYGSSVRDAVEPLVDSYGVELFDDGIALRQSIDPIPTSISCDEFGNSANDERGPQLQREQLPARSVPAALRLTYYDPNLDYQIGEARAAAVEVAGNEARQDLPVVLPAADAKSLAQQIVARSWGRRDKLTLQLPPKYLSLQPGNQLDLALSPALWTVTKTVVERYVVTVELRPSANGAIAVPAESGRIIPNHDVPTEAPYLALLDLPNVLEVSSDPVLLLAASMPGAGWKPQTLDLEFAGQSLPIPAARAKSLLGHAMTVLADGPSDLVDAQNAVEVQLIDSDHWLTSCDDEALGAGQNLAAIGDELIQFGQATSLGEGRFQLKKLLRGRGGTEWAGSLHTAGEVFCVLSADTLRAVTLPSATIGAVVTVTPRGDGDAVSTQFLGESVRPRSAVKLSAERQPNGDLMLAWVRRSRQGFAWIDEVDAPLGEAVERYRVTVTGASASVELEANEPRLTLAAATLESVGAGAAIVEIRQIGDLAVSRPSQITIAIG
jgi:hypothetical protein